VSSLRFEAGDPNSPSDSPAVAVPPPTAVEAEPKTLPAAGHLLTRWQRRYAALVCMSDLIVIVAGVTAMIVIDMPIGSDSQRAHVVSGMSAAGLLLIGLLATHAWDPRILGYGTAELKRLSRAVVGSGVLLALVGVAFTVVSVRVWVLVAIPLIGTGCAAARYGLRKWLHRRRRQGRCLLSTLAVGGYEEITDLVDRTIRDPHFGWVVAGACTPNSLGPDGTSMIQGVPVVGDLDDVAAVAGSGRYQVVAVAPTPGWGPARLHRLSWALENTAVELAVHPGLMEIAGPRLHIAPVDGMPLLRLTEPRFTGFARLLKNVVDRTFAVLLLTLLCPLLLAIALAVRLDGGPVLYFQERVGVGGRLFRMVKFRSMVVGADAKRDELAATNDGSGPLFKIHHDPRVTRVGAFLRRYSLDELPQVFNVLTGSMSLVGPRPPLPSEVQTYGVDAQRRLLVRPGMTGLWQVSGRSDLSWEESVRLDLRYVENWSLALDAAILWKTIGAVLGGRGAY
jgi:exopolysaccharide biosynthesis polyprenyl glycosylphosphotransferase